MDNISYWIDNTKLKNFDELNEDLECDVCIIGGGITGISTAYKLAKQGLNVVILEREKLASKTTGFTTAKITSQHGLFYDYLINYKGIEYAKGYLEANELAILDIKNIIDEENINKGTNYGKVYNYYYDSVEQEIYSKYKTGENTWSEPYNTGTSSLSQIFLNDNGDEVVVDSEGDEVTVTNTYYNHNLTDDQKSKIKEFVQGSYWLASPYRDCNRYNTKYGLHYVSSSQYYEYRNLFNSQGGDMYDYEYGVFAVVSI